MQDKIAGLLKTATELEAAIAEPLKAASENYFSRKIQPKNQDWNQAWAKLAFWTDVRNGLRQVQDALGALALIEKGGEWT